jgi:hypothetical protein
LVQVPVRVPAQALVQVRVPAQVLVPVVELVQMGLVQVLVPVLLNYLLAS